ncbi:hypothetical protein [Acinetobacter calcoaceticus]|uniref:hypothetical protein n=1 Tax=Acinetobacter calcoaceticus TaxID=471 RepID=UPI00124ED472|nr:hypothetical protein [Acinetobacter calcoaceticus]
MSGELSKSIGTHGEKVTRNLLAFIGWENTTRNLSVNCLKSTHTNLRDNKKRSHGEDEIFIYNCPVIDSRTIIVHISVKHTMEYLATESKRKDPLKKYILELAEIIECSQHTPQLKNLIDGFVNKRVDEVHIGLLVYTQNKNDNPDFDIKLEIPKINFEDKIKHPIYVIDNSKAEFLFQSINYMKNNFKKYKYTNPDFGFNLLNGNYTHTNHLTINMISSDILPFRVDYPDRFESILFVNEDFSENSLRKPIAYAIDFCKNFSKEIKIGFKDYNELVHAHETQEILNNFNHDHEIRVTPFCYISSFLNIALK